MYIDSHAHLTSDEVYSDIDGVLARAKQAEVKKVVNICTDPKTLERGIELSQRYPWVVNVGSTTPHDVEREGEEVFEIFARAARGGQLVAVGETGLDYYYTHSARDIQKDFLRRYIGLAKECRLPIVIHCREAFADLFEIIDSDYASSRGLLHCFTGTVEEARAVVSRGWMLSLSGIVTFKKSEVLREVARIIPLEQLLIETDSPYLAPQGHRGKQNEPSFLPATARVVAAERGISLEMLAAACTANAERFFGI